MGSVTPLIRGGSDAVALRQARPPGHPQLAVRGTQLKIVASISKKTLVVDNNVPGGTFVICVAVLTTVPLNARQTIRSRRLLGRTL